MRRTEAPAGCRPMHARTSVTRCPAAPPDALAGVASGPGRSAAPPATLPLRARGEGARLRWARSLTLLPWAVAGLTAQAADTLQPFGAAGAAPLAPWRVVALPDQASPLTRFRVVELDGRRAVRIDAESSYGNLVHPLGFSARTAALSWQWRLEQPMASADLRTREGDDTALKVCVMFDLPIGQVPFIERQLLRLARAKTGEPLPAATLCYVWDAHLPAGTTLDNAYTRRMRYVVVRSGTRGLNEWVAEKRDVAADFARVFGDESKVLPPIIAVAIGADGDNTRARSLAYVAGPELSP